MASYHIRSFSFPSKSHPVADQLSEQFCRLRSSQAASTSSVSYKLTELKELYKCVDEFLQLPQNQKTVSQTHSEQWVEEVLDGSVRLLDICGSSKDVLAQSKECLQDIQSALRRRCSGELNITNEAVQYLNSRKSAKKLIKKSLKNIKETEQSNKDNAIESMFQEVNTITLDIFKSVLSYIGGSKLESQKSKWSLVSKLMSQGDNKGSITANSDFNAVDAALESVIHQKNKNGAETLRNQMTKLESEIQSLDEELDSLFRHLVETRATLLNILSN